MEISESAINQFVNEFAALTQDLDEEKKHALRGRSLVLLCSGVEPVEPPFDAVHALDDRSLLGQGSLSLFQLLGWFRWLANRSDDDQASAMGMIFWGLVDGAQKYAAN